MSSSHSNIAIKVENLGEKYVINHELGGRKAGYWEVLDDR